MNGKVFMNHKYFQFWEGGGGIQSLYLSRNERKRNSLFSTLIK